MGGATQLTSSPISEDAARQALALKGSAAQDPTRYAGHRFDAGWVFSWAAEGQVPMGTAPWIVTDAGTALRVPIGKDAVDFLNETVADGSRR